VKSTLNFMHDPTPVFFFLLEFGAWMMLLFVILLM